MFRLFHRQSSFGRTGSTQRSAAGRSALRLESLEARDTPAVLVVTNTSDTGVAGDGSFRGEVRAAANGDTIVFDSTVTGSIQLTNQLGINKDLTIAGPGANVLSLTGSTSGVVYFQSNHTATISGLAITGGRNGFGGGLYNSGTLTLRDCTIAGNTSRSGPGGGGIYNRGSLTLEGCTVADNASTTGGGGIYSVGTLVLRNSTVAGNTAGGNGGGIFTAAAATIQNSTVADNTAGTGTGGGLYVASGAAAVTVQSTIVSGNTGVGGPDDVILSTGTLNADHSLFQVLPAGTINGTDAANVTGVDPLLGPLQDNGGPTATMALSAAGPAVDAGSNPADLATDQRGAARAVGPTDIGAFELQAPPVVTGIETAAGPGTGGTTVTITGTGFTAFARVAFGATPAASVVVNSATSITAVAPPGAGVVDVTVTTTIGTTATSAADRFTYQPVVTGLDAVAGPATGGTVVTITGGGFTADARVAFGAAPAASVVVNSATSITAVAPSGVPGPVDVTVTAPAGTSPTVAAARFTYLTTPAVAAVSPEAGPLAGGKAVTVTGSGFVPGATVTIGGTPATGVTVTSPTSITAVTPAGTAGPAAVVVTNPDGGTVTAAAAYAYVAAPAITAVGPAAGPTAGGTAVTVTGTGFTTTAAVTVGGALAAFTVDSDTSVTVVTPAGAAGPADVAVTTAGGTGTAAGGFTYAAAPTIRGVVPVVGSAGGATAVTITGTNLDGATSVRIGSVDASILRHSPTQLVVSLPAGVSGPAVVSVTTPGGLADGAGPVLVGSPRYAVGADAGGDGRVTLYNPDRTVALTADPFPGRPGGVRTAVGDVNGDGVPDLAVGTGPGAAAEVKVLDGTTGAVLFDARPFADFTGGVFVTAGDVTGDGAAELVVTPDVSGGPRVTVYGGRDFTVLANFLGIDDPTFRGGARAGLGDVNGDGHADLVVSAGFGGGPRVSTYDGAALAGGRVTHLSADFFLFEPALRNGAYVAVGDVDGDGLADVVGGAGPGGAPRVVIVSGRSLLSAGPAAALAAPVASFFTGDSASRDGVRVAAKDLDADGRADVVAGDGAGDGSRVAAYSGRDLAAGRASATFDIDAVPGFHGGVFVG